jgi:hypothetical protein
MSSLCGLSAAGVRIKGFTQSRKAAKTVMPRKKEWVKNLV